MKLERFKKVLFAIATLVFMTPSFAIQDQHAGAAAEKDVVVLIHGLGRSNDAMSHMARMIDQAGYEVHTVGYSSFNAQPQEMIEEVSRQVNDCCIGSDRKIHFVGHSLGGLMIRAYLQEITPVQLGYSVFLGTPNKGTEVADRYQGNKLINLLLPAALALGTDESSLPNQLELPYYPVGIIAGVSGKSGNDDYLPGPDDGLVTVESTKLDGMSDFIEINVRHYELRTDSKVADQVLAFLNEGKFNHDDRQRVSMN